jgi:hypothetical protein
MPGVFVVHTRMSVAQAIDEILLAVQCSSTEEWAHMVIYFPLS